MRIDSSVIVSMVEEENPFPAIWKFILDRIWVESTDELGLYYDRESRMVDFEAFLVETMPELYSPMLVDACTSHRVETRETDALVVMDALSVREGVLLASELKRKGYNVGLNYGFSAIPSDTASFKQKIGLAGLRKEHSYAEINNPDSIKLSGDEQIVWSSFPDRILSTLSSGRVKYGNITDLYTVSLRIVLAVMKALKAERIVITSDHGYMCADTSHTSRISRRNQQELSRVLGGDRFTKKIGKRERLLIDSGLLVQVADAAVVRGLYTWPVPGKYSLYQHGGISLVECLTPVITVSKTTGVGSV